MSDLDSEIYQNETSQLKVNHTENITNTDIKQTTEESQKDSGKKKKIIMWSLIGGGLVVAVALAVALSITLVKNSESVPFPDPNPIEVITNPYDWYEFNPYQALEDPDLTFGNDYQQQTTLLNGYVSVDNSMTRLFSGYQPVDPSLISDGENNVFPEKIQLKFALIDNYQVNLNISDEDDSYYSVPRYAFERPVLSWEARFTQVGFQQAKGGEPYFFNFSNIYNGETIISTTKRKLLVSEKYSEIGFILPNNRIFGIGQHNSQFQLQKGTYTLWSRYRPDGLRPDGQMGGQNGPHIHPFIMGQTQNRDFYGIFFASSAAMAFEIIQFTESQNVILNYIQAGGKMEIYFFMRGSAQEILSRYHKMIGFPQVPPYYALGFFQGSNSYESLEQVQSVVDQYAANTMALEGVIIDNYYQSPNELFTVSSTNFPDLSAFSASLASSNQHLLLGLMSGLTNQVEDNEYYDDLISSGCYVQSTLVDNQPLVGVQQCPVIYPEFTCGSGIEKWYKNGLQDLDAISHFSGLLLQHNQYYSAINGEIVSLQGEKKLGDDSVYNEKSSGDWAGSYQINSNQDQISTYFVPFVEGYFWSGNHDNMSISTNATHSYKKDDGITTLKVAEMYMHNINGHENIKAVYNGLLSSKSISSAGKRPFIFSDSTWLGSGKYAAVALTDMWREWASLRNTISMAMSLSMEGVSNIASDVCGSIGDMDEQLCGRWAQLGAFLPLMRNYYNKTQWDFAAGDVKSNPGSEFFNLQDYDYKFMASSALNQRIMYHRYIYSQLYRVYRYGGAIVSPLLFEYPMDDLALSYMDSTFFLGDAVKVSPVLDKDVTDSFDSYFPAGKWADLNDWSIVSESVGELLHLTPSFAYTNLHLKEGKIIPFQSNPNQYKTTQDFLTKVPMEFIVHRDASNYAEGFIVVDDGISVDSWDNVDFAYWKLRYADKSINFWIDWGKFDYSVPEGYTIDTLGAIHILDASDLAGTNFACFLGLNLYPTELESSYNPYTQVLTIKPVAGATVRFQDIGFVKFGNSFVEPNFCDYAQAFTYKIDGIDGDASTDQFLVMSASSLQGTDLLPQLAVTVRLMDNDGTISLNITTWEDYQATLADSETLFRPQHVTDWTAFPEDKVTKRLDDFFTFKAKPFSYQIFAEGSPTSVLYESDPNKLYFDKYMLFDSGIFTLNQLNGSPLMGMGESAGDLFYTKSGIYSRWTHDQANPIDDGLPPGKNMYGFQPMYVYQSEVKSAWVGVFDLNPYATDYLLDFNDGVGTQVTKVSIGGMIQKYFMVGSSPDSIITKYQSLTGFPTIPPLWAFGWQQCRFGYKDDSEWMEVVTQYEANDLPLDTMWADIDYMDDYKIFTVSESRYSHLAEYVEQIHAKGMTFVPIMDVGVAVREDGYKTYQDGLEQGVFIMQYDNSAPLTAGVWCGHAYFPSFFHPNIEQFWHSQFDYLRTNYGIEFDGIWLDENEATNFCNGYCIDSERPVDTLRNKPFYVPGWRDLEDESLGVDGLHKGVWNGKDLHEYDLHNLYPLMQVKATASYLTEKMNLRPYILSRSNFPGIQKWGNHWIGDNWSTVEYLQLSVDLVYQYQLFGLPFMGSDICGFNGDAKSQVCTRWHQLGSLYPFARNHNQNATSSQEPYVFSDEYQPGVAYVDLIRTALRNRYAFIKYYYSKFHDMHAFGGSFFKPLFFEWTDDQMAYQNKEINILLGEALKLSIQTGDALDQITTTSYYFPQAKWCQILPEMTDASTQCFDLSQGGESRDLPSTLADYQVHLRSGYIVAVQDAVGAKVMTTNDLKNLPLNFKVLPESANQLMSTSTSSAKLAAAKGYLYYDDGVTLGVEPSRFDFFFVLSKGAVLATLEVKQVLSAYPAQGSTDEQVGMIEIMMASSVGLDGAGTVQAKKNDDVKTTVNVGFEYDAARDVLAIHTEALKLSLYDLDSIQIL